MTSSSLPARRRTTVPLAAALAALVASLLTVLFAPPAAAADMDCSDFASQREAQRFYLRHGGPQSDPHRLDSDSDGDACETLGPPYYTAPTPPTSPPKTRKPRRPVVVDTTASLAVKKARRIAGERVVLTGRVAPAMRRPVVLQRKAGRTWKQVKAGSTNRRGVFKHRTVAGRKDVRYRLVASSVKVGRKQYTADKSRRVRVNTIPQRVRLVLPTTGTTGTDVVGRVVARPARNGRPVLIERFRDADWVQVAAGKLAPRSDRLTLRLPAAAGTHRYRAVLVGWKGASRKVSRVRDIDVAKPVDTTPPATPTNLVATAGDGQVELTWEAVSDGDLAGYVVEWAESVDGTWTKIAPNPTTNSATVDGLTNGTPYWFRVSSIDSGGLTSTPSAPVEETPEATEPPVM